MWRKADRPRFCLQITIPSHPRYAELSNKPLSDKENFISTKLLALMVPLQ